jgi:hypothetical protein
LSHGSKLLQNASFWRSIFRMTLSRSNPHLRSSANRRAALRRSAQTSSAVEGIHAPFAKAKGVKPPKDVKAFIAYWKRRAAESRR